MLKDDRDKYNEFYKNFGMQLKFGCYDSFAIGIAYKNSMVSGGAEF